MNNKNTTCLMMTQSKKDVTGPSFEMNEKSGKRLCFVKRFRIKLSNKTQLNISYFTSSLKPMCMPQSNIIFLPPIDTSMQLLPRSFYLETFKIRAFPLLP